MSPYRSKKQEAFFHTDTAKKKGISESTVKEFDTASKGKKLLEYAPRTRLAKSLAKAK